MPLLSCRNLSKSFGATRALHDITFDLEPGEIVGLVGENGAGKSTLIKILSGVLRPDHGELIWRGAPTVFADPYAALASGIATIHQELAYFEKLTVAENLLLGEPWPRTFWGGVDWRALHARAAEQLRRCNLTLDPGAMFHTLSPAQRQEVAIARALSRDARLLILDEPTASLTEPEVERLLGHLARLKAAGVAILYVSHRLDEILRITNRVLVFRDGSLAAQHRTSEATVEILIHDMVGREISILKRRAAEAIGPVTFEATALSRDPFFHDINLTVHAGEIVGLAGLVGAGRSELARAIFGLYPPSAGEMRLEGKPFHPRNPSAAQACGIAYLPEERKRQGLVLEHSVGDSISLGLLTAISRFGWISAGRNRHVVDSGIKRFSIKTENAAQPVGTLSGGNQQKVLLARCLETNPRLIILDEPTRGVDVGAKAEIHALIERVANSGAAVLLISSDLPEVLSISDRILVLHAGRITAEFAAASQEQILLAASGFTRSAAARP